jgi:hypothetical protein
MRWRCSIAALVAAVACDRPSPLIICHNANCVEPETSRDDTLDALSDGLALRYDGRPTLDGVEWDTLWYATESRCLFAHDLESDASVPAIRAAQTISDYLATTDFVSWNGDRFYVFIELKRIVKGGSDDHTPEQLTAHAECALDALDVILAGASMRGHRLTVGFTSEAPALLAALTMRPRWPLYAGSPDLELMLVGDIWHPYTSSTPELADYTVPLQAIEYHPDFVTATQRETYRSLGLESVQYQFVTTPESLDSIERWRPDFVLTNEAYLLRSWCER